MIVGGVDYLMVGIFVVLVPLYYADCEIEVERGADEGLHLFHDERTFQRELGCLQCAFLQGLHTLAPENHPYVHPPNHIVLKLLLILLCLDQ